MADTDTKALDWAKTEDQEGTWGRGTDVDGEYSCGCLHSYDNKTQAFNALCPVHECI